MRTDQRTSDWREGRRSEVQIQFRFACERLARSMFVKANGSTVRMLAREIECEALRTACIECDKAMSGRDEKIGAAHE